MSEESIEQKPIEFVQLDVIAVLKIIKHCSENLPNLVAGQLLGMTEENNALGVTNSFAFPTSSKKNDEEDTFQIEMMNCLREVSIDSSAVGWYQSTFLGSYLSEDIVATQYEYQSNLKNAVLIVYDPIKTNQGAVALQAFRLTAAFMSIYAKGVYTKKSFEEGELTFNHIFEEVPVRVRANILSTVLLEQLQGSDLVDTADHVMALHSGSFLEKNFELLIDSVDELADEQAKLAKFSLAQSRRRHNINQWLARRRAENVSRVSRGLEALPESLEVAERALPMRHHREPSRLEALLLTRQLALYCDSLESEADSSTAKLNAVKALTSST